MHNPEVLSLLTLCLQRSAFFSRQAPKTWTCRKENASSEEDEDWEVEESSSQGRHDHMSCYLFFLI